MEIRDKQKKISAALLRYFEKGARHEEAILERKKFVYSIKELGISMAEEETIDNIAKYPDEFYHLLRLYDLGFIDKILNTKHKLTKG